MHINDLVERNKSVTGRSLGVLAAILLCAFVITKLIANRVHWCADPPCPPSQGRNLLPVTVLGGRGVPNQKTISKFPLIVYSEAKQMKLGRGLALECAVCLNEFENGETLRLLPKCSHGFHPECIDAWLFGHSNCPVCRSDLVPESEELIGGEDKKFDREVEIQDHDEHRNLVHMRVDENIATGFEKTGEDEDSLVISRSSSTGDSTNGLSQDHSERFPFRVLSSARQGYRSSH
ncbi:hypothetical protein Droror1_Dr00021903 [Drosera rotundifolia]